MEQDHPSNPTFIKRQQQSQKEKDIVKDSLCIKKNQSVLSNNIQNNKICNEQQILCTIALKNGQNDTVKSYQLGQSKSLPSSLLSGSLLNQQQQNQEPQQNSMKRKPQHFEAQNKIPDTIQHGSQSNGKILTHLKQGSGSDDSGTAVTKSFMKGLIEILKKQNQGGKILIFQDQKAIINKVQQIFQEKIQGVKTDLLNQIKSIRQEFNEQLKKRDQRQKIRQQKYIALAEQSIKRESAYQDIITKMMQNSQKKQ